MSRKPTIKLSYPDASTLAMQLTDAMIRRAPGKRILETTSEDKAGDGEGSLLDGLNSVRTSTGVEMTLTLEPNSMDYALEQLIRPNLTAEEKKSIFGEESTSTDEMLPSSAPAEEQTAPDQEKQIEIGKIEAVELRRIISDLQDDMNHHRGDQIEIAHRAFDAICEAAHMTEHDFAVDTSEEEETSNTWLTAMLATLIHLASNSKASKKNRARDIAFDFLSREEIGIPDSAWTTCAAIDKALEEAYKIAGAINKADRGQVDADELLERLLHEMDPNEYPMEENVQLDKADEAEAEQDGEIEPGLLNDIDDKEEGGA